MLKRILMVVLPVICLLLGGCSRQEGINLDSMAGLLGPREEITEIVFESGSYGNVRAWMSLTETEREKVLDTVYAIDTTQFAPYEGGFGGAPVNFRLSGPYGSRIIQLYNTTGEKYIVLRTEENVLYTYQGPADAFDFFALYNMLIDAGKLADDPVRCAVASASGRTDTLVLNRKRTALATALLEARILDAALSQDSAGPVAYDLELQLGETLWQLNSTTGACARRSAGLTIRGTVPEGELMALKMLCGLGALLQ